MPAIDILLPAGLLPMGSRVLPAGLLPMGSRVLPAGPLPWSGIHHLCSLEGGVPVKEVAVGDMGLEYRGADLIEQVHH